VAFIRNHAVENTDIRQDEQDLQEGKTDFQKNLRSLISDRLLSWQFILFILLILSQFSLGISGC